MEAEGAKALPQIQVHSSKGTPMVAGTNPAWGCIDRVWLKNLILKTTSSTG